MKRLVGLLVLLLPILCCGQAVPGCGTFTSSGAITATSNSTISDKQIDLGGAATIGINIPNGIHDVHITRCVIKNGTTANGLIKIGSGCYNITIDTCFLESGWRGINAVGATNNIHIWYNFFHNINDPNVTATSSDGGGSSVQLNNCNGSSIQVLDNKSYHDVSGPGIGDQYSVFQSNGTAASPIRVCRNQALNGSNNPPNTGYVAAVGGDVGGSWQRIDSNTFVNCGSVIAQIQGGHDIEMSYNTGYLAQTSYTSVGMAFGNYSGQPCYNITMAYNNVRCISANGSVFNYWYDPTPKTYPAFAPTGWSTNTTSTSLNSSILPNPLWPPCSSTPTKPSITYSPATNVYTVGTAIASLVPTNTGGNVVSYSVSPSLPTGIGINSTNGIVSGTPTVATAQANYVVTATNGGGSSNFTLTLTVNNPVVVKPSISYSPNIVTATLGVAITPIVPSNSGGAATSFSIDSPLPAGFSFNTSNGQISGTGTAITASHLYTITASNSGGNGTAPFTLTVNDKKPVISYPGTPYTFTQGSAIVPINPTSTGGAVVTYSVSPSLPSGLSLSVSTGAISGQPTGTQSSQTYNITGSNTGGSAVTPISIAINPPAVTPPNISYSPSSQTVIVNNPIATMSPVNIGGAATGYTCSPTPPAGISFNTGNGVFSGVPTVTNPTTSYTVIGSNSGGISTTHVTLTVNQISPPSITYPYNNVIWIVGQPINPINPTNTGGTASSYAVTSGTLPIGISLNTSTGQLSGTPTSTQAPTGFTITASNAGGSSPFSITAGVNPAPVNLWYLIDGKFFGPVASH